MTQRKLVILGCSSQQPTRNRNHSAYLFFWNEEGFLFDPGEGTQRQFIFANVKPPQVTRIFITHFHGDHCLGLGSFLMRLNLDKVTHPIHCYYPASGKTYFDRLRYGTIYKENITVIEHPISDDGIVEDNKGFKIEAKFLDHGVDVLGYRVTANDKRKFNTAKLKEKKIWGPNVKELKEKGSIEVNGKTVRLDEVSWMQKGDSIAVVLDTKICPAAFDLAKDVKLLLAESTYLEDKKDLAEANKHMTAKQAAQIAGESNAQMLVLTHFSARYLQSKDFEIEAREIFPNSHAAEDFKVFHF